MRIGVDVDEVLAKFNESFASFVEQKLNREIPLSLFRTYNLCETLQLPIDKVDELYYEYFEHEISSEMEPILNSLEIIEELAKEHELIIITARDSMHKTHTINWLEKHYPRIFKEVYFTNEDAEGTKGDIAEKYNIDIHIDDAHHNIINVAKKGIPCLLFNKPWNQEDIPENVKRVHSWEEIRHEINSLG